jgi:hypothetical protein
MKRVTFCHVVMWRDPETGDRYHVDEHKVLHVLAEDEPCMIQNILVEDDVSVEPGDWWDGSQGAPRFSTELFLGRGPRWDDTRPDMGRGRFNAPPEADAQDGDGPADFKPPSA